MHCGLLWGASVSKASSLTFGLAGLCSVGLDTERMVAERLSVLLKAVEEGRVKRGGQDLYPARHLDSFLPTFTHTHLHASHHSLVNITHTNLT